MLFFCVCCLSVGFSQYRQLAHYFSLLSFLLIIITLLQTFCCEYFMIVCTFNTNRSVETHARFYYSCAFLIRSNNKGISRQLSELYFKRHTATVNKYRRILWIKYKEVLSAPSPLVTTEDVILRNLKYVV